MRRTFVAIVITMALSIPLYGANVHLAADSQSIVVDPPASGDSIVLYGVMVGNHHYLTQIRTVAKVLRTERSNEALTFRESEGIPLRSVWAAVDPQSGDYTISARAGYPIHRLPFPATALHDGMLTIDCISLDVLLVRPGVGSWNISVRDGGFGDADRRGNGLLTVDWSRARAVEGDAEPPKALETGDVLVAIDPVHMDLFATQIGGGR